MLYALVEEFCPVSLYLYFLETCICSEGDLRFGGFMQ